MSSREAESRSTELGEPSRTAEDPASGPAVIRADAPSDAPGTAPGIAHLIAILLLQWAPPWRSLRTKGPYAYLNIACQQTSDLLLVPDNKSPVEMAGRTELPFAQYLSRGSMQLLGFAGACYAAFDQFAKRLVSPVESQDAWLLLLSVGAAFMYAVAFIYARLREQFFIVCPDQKQRLRVLKGARSDLGRLKTKSTLACAVGGALTLAGCVGYAVQLYADKSRFSSMYHSASLLELEEKQLMQLVNDSSPKRVSGPRRTVRLRVLGQLQVSDEWQCSKLAGHTPEVRWTLHFPKQLESLQPKDDNGPWVALEPRTTPGTTPTGDPLETISYSAFQLRSALPWYFTPPDLELNIPNFTHQRLNDDLLRDLTAASVGIELVTSSRCAAPPENVWSFKSSTGHSVVISRSEAADATATVGHVP